MESNPFSRAHHKRLVALHKIKHKRVGEDIRITLVRRRAATGKMDETIKYFETGWTKYKIRKEFLGQRDAESSYEEGFEVSAELLHPDDARVVAGVVHGDTLYTVKVSPGPSGLQQYWRLKIVSVAKNV